MINVSTWPITVFPYFSTDIWRNDVYTSSKLHLNKRSSQIINFREFLSLIHCDAFETSELVLNHATMTSRKRTLNQMRTYKQKNRTILFTLRLLEKLFVSSESNQPQKNSTTSKPKRKFSLKLWKTQVWNYQDLRWSKNRWTNFSKWRFENESFSWPPLSKIWFTLSWETLSKTSVNIWTEFFTNCSTCKFKNLI